MSNTDQTQNPSPKSILIPFNKYTAEEIADAVIRHLGIRETTEESLKKVGIEEIKKEEGTFSIQFLPNKKKSI